jgi:gluconolactonase
MALATATTITPGCTPGPTPAEAPRPDRASGGSGGGGGIPGGSTGMGGQAGTPHTDGSAPGSNAQAPGGPPTPTPNAPGSSTDGATPAPSPPDAAGADGPTSGNDPKPAPAPLPPLGDFPLAALQNAKPALFAASGARVEGPSWRGGDVFFAADGVGFLRADAQGKVFRYHPTLNPVGSLVLADDSLLVCEKQHVLLQIFPDGKVAVLVGEGAGAQFCNDVTVDGSGNIYFSDSRAGAIMKLTPAGELTKWVTGRRYTNGVEVDRENKYLYFSDTGVNTLFRVPMGPGGTAGAVESLGPMIADGMAMDAWGNVWLAQITAGVAMVYDPNKRQVIARVNMGGPQATNLAFGGPAKDVLFTTVASKGVMRVPVGVRGFSHPGATKYTIKSMLDLAPANTPVN